MSEKIKPKTKIKEEIPTLFKDSFFIAEKGGLRTGLPFQSFFRFSMANFTLAFYAIVGESVKFVKGK